MHNLIFQQKGIRRPKGANEFAFVLNCQFGNKTSEPASATTVLLLFLDHLKAKSSQSKRFQEMNSFGVKAVMGLKT